MASHFPDGSKVFIASALAAAKNITVLTNANPAVATSNAHGLANGDFIVLESGWGELDGRVFKVTSADTNSFRLDGINTTDTKRYPAGAGIGRFRKINTWTEIRQISNIQMQGGEQQYGQFSYLDENFERQIPTLRSARSMTATIGDDPSLAGYKAAKTASDSRELTPLRIDLPTGSQLLYNGYPSLDEVPSLEKGQLMTVSLAYALNGDPNRY